MYWVTEKEVSSNLNKLLDGVEHVGVEALGLDATELHVCEQTVDNLQETLLHAGKAFFQQLQTYRITPALRYTAS